jgi:hypothetical protein
MENLIDRHNQIGARESLADCVCAKLNADCQRYAWFRNIDG